MGSQSFLIGCMSLLMALPCFANHTTRHKFIMWLIATSSPSPHIAYAPIRMILTWQPLEEGAG